MEPRNQDERDVTLDDAESACEVLCELKDMAVQIARMPFGQVKHMKRRQSMHCELNIQQHPHDDIMILKHLSTGACYIQVTICLLSISYVRFILWK